MYLVWFLSSPVPSSAKPGCSILSSPVQVWASLPSCPLQEPGASSGAGCLHPTARGHQGCCLAKPDPLTGACCGLRVGTTVLGPHSEPVHVTLAPCTLLDPCTTQGNGILYWEEPALRHRGVAVESLFVILCYIIRVLFCLQISLIPAVLSARMARRRWVLCVRHTVSWFGDCCGCHPSSGGHTGWCGSPPSCGGCQDGVRKCPGCISASSDRDVKKGS